MCKVKIAVSSKVAGLGQNLLVVITISTNIGSRPTILEMSSVSDVSCKNICAVLKFYETDIILNMDEVLLTC